MQLNRFMWEDVEKGVFRRNKRIRTILKIENVLSVISKNINQKKKDFFLDFLTIETKQMTDKTYEMNLIFSGNSVVKVIAEVIEVSLDDQGEPWNTLPGTLPEGRRRRRRQGSLGPTGAWQGLEGLGQSARGRDGR